MLENKETQNNKCKLGLDLITLCALKSAETLIWLSCCRHFAIKLRLKHISMRFSLVQVPPQFCFFSLKLFKSQPCLCINRPSVHHKSPCYPLMRAHPLWTPCGEGPL